MTKEQHIHKFKRLRYKSGNAIFFCVLPDCNRKFNTVLTLGKRNICWRCGEPFIMNEYSLKLSKPHCENCHKTKNQKDENNDINTNKNETKRELSLTERLQQTIQDVKKTSQPEERIDEDI